MARINTFSGGACEYHQIYPTRTYMKLDYVSSLLPLTACLGKICRLRYLGPKLTKSAIFSIFITYVRQAAGRGYSYFHLSPRLPYFRFFEFNCRIIHCRRIFCRYKYIAYQAASFPFFRISLQ